MRRFTTRAALLAIAALAVSVPAIAEGPKTDNDKAFYSFGFNLSQQLGMLNLTPAEFDQIKAGLSDGVMKKTPQADVKEFYPKFQQLARERVVANAGAEK